MDVESEKKFPERGVIVKLTKKHKELGIYVKEKDLGTKGVYSFTTGGDKLIRPVINIAFYSTKNPDEYLNEVNPPVEISVAYKQSDLDHVGNDKNKLKLVWLKGIEWKPFTREEGDFKFEDYPTILWAGWGSAKIKEWGDPPIAWGT